MTENRVRKNTKLSIQGYIVGIFHEKSFINLHINEDAELKKLERHLPETHLIKYKREGDYVLPVKFKHHHKFNDDSYGQEIKANINFIHRDNYCIHMLSDFKILPPHI
jgi:hypothetical protein